ncbi:MAG: tRNA uridine-5-carboxymethylaminomethyl(34) synthesis GTPase MnmE [bacterium]
MDGDVIVAEATPKGVGAISIVRLSGRGSIDMALKVIKGLPEKSKIEPRKIYFVDVESRVELIDKAMIVFYRKPRSYTGEDMVEIFCHGSPAVVSSILDLFVSKGARSAEPGEFTKRAFVNGKIDILKAEAVNSLSRSLTKIGSSIALSVLRGCLSKKIGGIRDKLLLISATVEALIEYEEDVDYLSSIDTIEMTMADLIQTLDRLVSSYRSFSILSSGARVVIVGRKNSGKTTLFNHLLGFERGIVSEYPGTTRDYIKETIKLGDYIISLTDIAGLGGSTDELDILGVKVARDIIADSDIIILLIDIITGWGDIEEEIFSSIKDKEIILAISKVDIDKSRVSNIKDYIKDMINLIPIPISSFTNIGISELKGEVENRVKRLVEGETFLITERQKQKVCEMLDYLIKSYKMVKGGYNLEMIAEEIRLAVNSLEGLLGRGLTEDMIETIFSQFCVGK